jgi:hypothetical protein
MAQEENKNKDLQPGRRRGKSQSPCGLLPFPLSPSSGLTPQGTAQISSPCNGILGSQGGAFVDGQSGGRKGACDGGQYSFHSGLFRASGSLIAGVLVLIMPRLLNYVVAIYLIITGILGLLR